MKPTLEQIMEAVGGKINKAGDAVVVGYGSIGYLTLRPASVVVLVDPKGPFNGPRMEVPAARIEGRLYRADGANQAKLRSQLRAAGLEVA